jgi:hypothetical protein
LQRTQLDFSHYLLGEHGGFALASAVRVNAQLSAVKLRFAALGNAAVIALAQAIQHNKNGCIRSLDLEGNGAGLEVGPAVAELLSCSPNLSVSSSLVHLSVSQKARTIRKPERTELNCGLVYMVKVTLREKGWNHLCVDLR